MPFVLVSHSLPVDRAVDLALAQDFTALMQDVLGKKGELTSVRIERTAEAVWTIGGAPQPIAAHVEGNITQGTNTPEEKALFMRQAMDQLRLRLGVLPEATYVILREVPATDWGYDGRTQESRRPGNAPPATAVS